MFILVMSTSYNRYKLYNVILYTVKIKERILKL